MTTDFLVIGSGAAGLAFAIRAAELHPDKSVLVLTKSAGAESSRLAQGGVAAAMDAENDNAELHVRDTLKAGSGLCDRRVAEILAFEAPNRIVDLMNWGANFDGGSSRLRLGLEGGHSANRIVHRGDTTGEEIMRTLFGKARDCPNIVISDRYFAADLTVINRTYNPSCIGVWLYDKTSDRFIACRAGSTMLATGGIGAIFQGSTNPAAATGDGIAMASRAGAATADMEFIQFHPTALYENTRGRRLLLTEALRGAGAKLRNGHGEVFMANYDMRSDLAPRDVVSRAIIQEIARTGIPYVYLDCKLIYPDRLRNEFAMICRECLNRGIDLLNQWAPVNPAMHYLCGGIVTDLNGRTNIHALYAAGECARTGLHGANRLASNSLAEALVFGKRAANVASPEIIHTDAEQTYRMPSVRCYAPDTLRGIMSAVGVICTTKSLASAANKLTELRQAYSEFGQNNPETCEILEFHNMLEVASLVIEQSLKRSVNAGTFWNAQLARDGDPRDKTLPVL